jgi:hypothetical protein
MSTSYCFVMAAKGMRVSSGDWCVLSASQTEVHVRFVSMSIDMLFMLFTVLQERDVLVQS